MQATLKTRGVMPLRWRQELVQSLLERNFLLILVIILMSRV
jgi:hypothetical protein